MRVIIKNLNIADYSSTDVDNAIKEAGGTIRYTFGTSDDAEPAGNGTYDPHYVIDFPNDAALQQLIAVYHRRFAPKRTDLTLPMIEVNYWPTQLSELDHACVYPTG